MRDLKNKTLSPRQRAFIDAFMVCRNGAEAVRKAGYRCKNPGEYAGLLLRHDPVREEVARREADLRRVSQMEAEEVVTLLSIVGRANIKTYLNGDWSLKPLAEIPEALAYAIESVKETTRTTGGKQPETIKVVEFKLKDSLAALDKLAKHLGFYKADNEQIRPMGTLSELHERLNLKALSAEEVRTLRDLILKMQGAESTPTQ